VPEDWTPDEAASAYALGKGMSVTTVAAEAEKFRTWHRSRGTRFKRVDLGWHTWVRNWAERQDRQAPVQQAAPLQHTTGRKRPTAWT
jgi:hypothetical protein